MLVMKATSLLKVAQSSDEASHIKIVNLFYVFLNLFKSQLISRLTLPNVRRNREGQELELRGFL